MQWVWTERVCYEQKDEHSSKEWEMMREKIADVNLVYSFQLSDLFLYVEVIWYGMASIYAVNSHTNTPMEGEKMHTQIQR